MSKRFDIVLLVLVLGSGCLVSCTDNISEQTGYSNVNIFSYNFLHEYYYWYQELPALEENPNLGNKNHIYSENNNSFIYDTSDPFFQLSPQDFIDAVRYQRLDRWSYIIDLPSYERYFVRGEDVSYGFSVAVDDDDFLRVLFAYDQSPVGKAGVGRGDKLLSINGVEIRPLLLARDYNRVNSLLASSSATMTFETLQGQVINRSFVPGSFSINPLLAQRTFQVNGQKVGYLVYNSFLSTSKIGLDSAFVRFKSEGITDLVLDLRYNGGGDLSLAAHLASLIHAAPSDQQVFSKLQFNDKQQENNEVSYFEFLPDKSLGLSRLFVIATDNTASASESLINGLKPFIDVKIIGTSTHGKPVGMIPHLVHDGQVNLNYVLVAVMFTGANAEGFYDYFDGLPADVTQPDDLTRNFGDSLELCLQQALFYVENGSFASSAQRQLPVAYLLPEHPFRQLVGTW
ncbi:MAG: hypothetical protein HC842_07950 [Cytophagales bacterium]|nr:hypothetical protein [Cytophagales bacterium]